MIHSGTYGAGVKKAQSCTVFSYCLFGYGFLAVNAVELEHYADISLEKLLLLKALAMKMPKYEQDVRLIDKKILVIQYGKER